MHKTDDDKFNGSVYEGKIKKEGSGEITDFRRVIRFKEAYTHQVYG